MLDLEQLAALYERHRSVHGARVREFALRDRILRFNSRAYLMGVINLSADSWYRESVCLSAESAVERGLALHAQGAAIVDVGAESTLAHASRLDRRSQVRRLRPVIEPLAAAGIVVSVETYHPRIAAACLSAGASLLNLTGTQGTERFYRLAQEYNAAVILCYVQGRHVRAVGDLELDADMIPRMYEYFARETDKAIHCGLERLLIDPGLGFYYRNLQDSNVRVQHQMNVFLNTFRLRTLGLPVCHALPHAFEYFREEVRCAEPFFAVLAALGHTDLFRTHEVPRVRAVLQTLGRIPATEHQLPESADAIKAARRRRQGPAV
jgi:dihydropteroate synthase